MMGGFVVAHNLRCHRAVLDFQFSVMRRGILLAPNNVLGLEDWRTGGLEDWRTGGLEDWRTGGLEDWRTGGLACLTLPRTFNR
jgi:hypothetical protein